VVFKVFCMSSSLRLLIKFYTDHLRLVLARLPRYMASRCTLPELYGDGRGQSVHVLHTPSGSRRGCLPVVTSLIPVPARDKCITLTCTALVCDVCFSLATRCLIDASSSQACFWEHSSTQGGHNSCLRGP